MDKKISLYIVPTPIGNLDDITLRALNILKEVDLILCEDTRVTRKLLNHYKIDKPLKSYHAYNEHKILSDIVEQLKEGSVMALVSDAGTPGISDPGFLIIRECLKNDIPVQCLPGPVAFVPALVQLYQYLDENRSISVSREISKVYEETVTGTPEMVRDYFSDHSIKGEFVVVIKGKV